MRIHIIEGNGGNKIKQAWAGTRWLSKAKQKVIPLAVFRPLNPKKSHDGAWIPISEHQIYLLLSLLELEGNNVLRWDTLVCSQCPLTSLSGTITFVFHLSQPDCVAVHWLLSFSLALNKLCFNGEWDAHKPWPLAGAEQSQNDNMHERYCIM